jgi:F0F1-type ATP synthase membrane subunit b/b'|tara:strand:+ start:593 stop:754 length:162 start_codon:yes stop_codon:yes gene_type:complete
MTEWKDNLIKDEFVDRLKGMREEAEKIISNLQKEKEELQRELKNGRMAEKQSS